MIFDDCVWVGLASNQLDTRAVVEAASGASICFDSYLDMVCSQLRIGAKFEITPKQG
jgi:hypothetical protein